MARLLHLDASPRGDRSHTRKLSAEFAAAWRAAHPGGAVVYRDLGHQPLPHINEALIAAGATPPDQRTPELRAAVVLSDELVDELLAADHLVAGVPMYNFTVPSGFKAYIDHIVRAGRAFGFDPSKPNPYIPLVHGKRAVFVTAAGGGGYGRGGGLEQYNHLHPYLAAIFGFIGITDVAFVQVENATAGDVEIASSLAAARAKAGELATRPA